MATLAMAQPQATWLERQHDFGVILEEDGKAKCAMRVVNTGDQPLLIVKAQAGCGCTGITFPETPVPPGDTALVSISYNPSGRPGEFSKDVIIHTNTVPKRTTLEITGNVIPSAATLDKQYPLRAGALRISQSMLPFGELARGAGKVLYLSAYHGSTDTLIVQVSGNKPHLHPAMVPDTVPPARVTALTVHYLSANAPLWGLNTDTLTLSCRSLNSDHGDLSGMATVQVMAQVTENFDRLTDRQRHDAPVARVDCGDRIDFGTVKRGDIVSRTFTITNKGREKLHLRRLWAPEGEGITTTTDKQEAKRGKSITATVTVDTSRHEGELINVPLTLMCNDPETPQQIIRLVGIIDN